MKSNTEQLKIAEKYLGESCPKCCSMSNNCCCYFVSKIFKAADNASLFYGGATVTYCPNAIKWCKANLAQIPIYLAMPSDIIFFDWELNGVPNHIGFVDHRISDQQVATLEGNTTSKYVVARRTREVKYVQGVFRPHFKASYDTSKALEIDGQFGYNSIAMLQKALGVKVDGILGRDTVKALQKKAGVTQDGSWGVNTSKAVQKMVGTTVDGAFGDKSVRALQTWINKQVGKTTASTDKTPSAQPQSPVAVSDKLVVDGAFGKKSIMKAQKYFGTEADGIISGQLKANKNKLSGIDYDCITWGGKGSDLVRAMQKKFGLKQDGVLGTDTIKALQQFLVVTVDGSWGAKTSRAFQVFLNSPTTYKTGKVTIKEESVSTKDDANVKIGQACSDYDKKAGDGNGREVTKSSFSYSTSSTSPYNWTYVFRPKDGAKAEKAASMCLKAVANNNIGYSHNGEGEYGKAKAMTKLAKAVNYDLSKINVKCGLSCGDLVCLCNHYAGLSTCYIGRGLQLANELKKNNNFECIPYKKGMKLKRGDTLITAHSNGKHNHAAMVVEGASPMKA